MVRPKGQRRTNNRVRRLWSSLIGKEATAHCGLAARIRTQGLLL